MADRFKHLEMSQISFLRFQVNWRATLIIVALLAVILLPILGSFVGRIQSATFPYPGLQMEYQAFAIDRVNVVPTCSNQTLTATFQDLYSNGGKLLLRVSIVIHDSTTSTITKYIDIKTRQEYVAENTPLGSALVSAGVYTVLWLPRDLLPGQMVGVNSFIGQLEAPVNVDAFGQTFPMGGSAYRIRTAEGFFYYSPDTRVLEKYESNVAITTLCPGARKVATTPLRSITLMSYNDVAARGTMQGLIASLGVLLAVVIVFYFFHEIDRRRKGRLEGLRNRVRSLSEILEDQYLLGFISRETYMRKQVVLRRLASEIESETQARVGKGEIEPPSSEDDYPAP